MSEFKGDSTDNVNHAGLGMKAQAFTVELVIENQVIKSAIGGLNKESIIALLTIATAVNMPRIQGWNLFDGAGNMIASVDAMAFLAQLGEGTPIGKPPADPKTAGWRALPVVTPTSKEFEKMIETAKKEGKVPT